ncbi:hypothetical protein SAMN04487859_11632 [Roseovarius lutimaris]|uniref:Asp/Glu/Hydantoin racemase n=1 Tax=Roseovarius lutimaris TaxID=1005928 RepID=A0A1I5EIV9_9RHOB|nr:hypothetical protein [Roseovarius lutimaris]SFO11444.1 hypothetical protein SAMN04487859_11632 [Roseovarius lutimaris]
MTLTLLHTAEAHRASFDALRDKIAPGARLVHIVRPDFLERAQDGIDAALGDEIAATIASAPGPVICTCTTIGPVAARAGAIRVDWPMMQAAARTKGAVLMVYCLESTRAPSLELLQDAMRGAGHPGPLVPLPLPALWPLFAQGKTTDFAKALARAILDQAVQMPDLGAIVLAQASMAGAAPMLGDLGVAVLSSPELALRAGLARL